jgi:hypothetical protein
VQDVQVLIFEDQDLHGRHGSCERRRFSVVRAGTVWFRFDGLASACSLHADEDWRGPRKI